jgi:DNA-binding GntR family transcriptional regulator
MNAPPLRSGNGRIGASQVRDRLRQSILDGTLRPGVAISQKKLAQETGFGRTPLREALRLLQEEGLVQAELNQRVRVARLDVANLEALYASRIMLETLALSLTIPHLTQVDFDALELFQRQMRTASRQKDGNAWEEGNKQFHGLLSSHVEGQLSEAIQRFISGSERYRRHMVRTTTRAWEVAEAEHATILAACREGNQQLAMQRLARHLARTALTLIVQVAPTYEPATVRTALRIFVGDAGGTAEWSEIEQEQKRGRE